jgi:tight adherence protein C
VILFRQDSIRKLKGEAGEGATAKFMALLAYARQAFTGFNGRFSGGKRYKQAAFMLAKTGMNSRMGLMDFMLAEQAAAAGIFAVCVAATSDIFLSLAAGAAGFFLPWMTLKSKVRKKEEAILAELPDALDIIAAGIEGGLSLNASLARYASGYRNAFSDEISLAVRQMQLGRSSSEALGEMEAKLDMKEVSSFTGSYLQAEKTGGNVKKVIKAQADEVRKQRFMRLKKQAHEAPVKLLIPLMIFIFPVVFIVLFGPIIIKLMSGL